MYYGELMIKRKQISDFLWNRMRFTVWHSNPHTLIEALISDKLHGQLWQRLGLKLKRQLGGYND
jgi:hypothetical protein